MWLKFGSANETKEELRKKINSPRFELGFWRLDLFSNGHMKEIFQLVSLIESCKFQNNKLEVCHRFLHITYPNWKMQEYSIVTHENDTSTKQNH